MTSPGPTADQFENVRYVWGIICLMLTVAGTILHWYANRLAAKVIPPEAHPGAFLAGEEHTTAWRERIEERLRYAQQSSEMYTYGVLSLVSSVVAGLTINFPWLFSIAIAINFVLICVAVVVALRFRR